MLILCTAYPLIILIVGQGIAPWKADGWLIYNKNEEIIGSRMIAQYFMRPEYFHPRPSSVNYNAAGAGGSNLTPANPELRIRAVYIIKNYPQVTKKSRIPADLVTASGSGLDPHITLKAAEFQLARISSSSGISQQKLRKLLEKHSIKQSKIIGNDPLINVFQVNLEIDKMMNKHKQ